jgi:Rrf2 family protein
MIGGKYQYGLEIMLCLTKGSENSPIAKPKIAKSIGISQDYIEQIIRPLVKAGLIASQRGIKGGFYLATHPSKISVHDIIKALGGTTMVRETIKPLKSRRVWQEAESLLTSYFSSVTLEELIEK